MEAIMYQTGSVFHLETDGAATICEARFFAGEKVFIFCCNKLMPAAARTLQGISLLPDSTESGEFKVSFVSGTKSSDIIFRSLYKSVTAWNAICTTFFEYRKDPDFALYASILSRCRPNETGCVVIEDTTAGIKAMKELELDGKGHIFAMEAGAVEKGLKQVPSLMAYVWDIGYFIDLLGLYTRFDSWYGLISCMRKKGISSPHDGSFAAKSRYLELCRTDLIPGKHCS